MHVHPEQAPAGVNADTLLADGLLNSRKMRQCLLPHQATSASSLQTLHPYHKQTQQLNLLDISQAVSEGYAAHGRNNEYEKVKQA